MAVLSNTGIRAGAVAHAAASSGGGGDDVYQIANSVRFQNAYVDNYYGDVYYGEFYVIFD